MPTGNAEEVARRPASHLESSRLGQRWTTLCALRYYQLLLFRQIKARMRRRTSQPPTATATPQPRTPSRKCSPRLAYTASSDESIGAELPRRECTRHVEGDAHLFQRAISLTLQAGDRTRSRHYRFCYTIFSLLSLIDTDEMIGDTAAASYTSIDTGTSRRWQERKKAVSMPYRTATPARSRFTSPTTYGHF